MFRRARCMVVEESEQAHVRDMIHDSLHGILNVADKALCFHDNGRSCMFGCSGIACCLEALGQC